MRIRFVYLDKDGAERHIFENHYNLLGEAIVLEDKDKKPIVVMKVVGDNYIEVRVEREL